MIFPKKTINKIRYLILPFLTILFIVLFFGRNYFSGTAFFKKIMAANIKIARPVIEFKNLVAGLDADASSMFISKKKTDALINELREENLKLKSENMRINLLQKENEQILSVLGRNPDKKFIIASVLFYPPASDFDVLMIDAGEKEGVLKGMKVLAAGDAVALGEIAEVHERESKVKLYSYYGNKIAVLLENSGILANAEGRGGENFEISVPKKLAAREGEKIFLSGTERFVLGEVNKIVEGENAPFKKIYFRTPLNLNELSYVYVLRQ